MPSATDSLSARKAPYRSRPVQVEVAFSECEQTITTLEGPVACHPGDAILTGSQGERWPMPANQFHEKYQPVPGQQPDAPGRFTKHVRQVAAAQLHEPLQLTLSEGRGALSGQPGDWCVWYSPSDRAIVARDIFPALYETDAVSVFVQLGCALKAQDRQVALAVLQALALAMPHTPVVFTEEIPGVPADGSTWLRLVQQRHSEPHIIPTVMEIALDAIAPLGETDLAAEVKALAKRESVGAYSWRKVRKLRKAFDAPAQEAAEEGLEPIVIHQLAAIDSFNAKLKADMGKETKYPFIENRAEATESDGARKIFAIGAVADTLATLYQTRWQSLVLATTTDIADASAWTLLQKLPQTLIGLGLFAAGMLAAFSELGGTCDVADPLGFAWCAGALWEHWAAPVFFVAYVLALVSAWRRYATAKAERWEARHQDYRLLTECLRVLHTRAILGAPACVASDLPLAEPADSGWVLLALRSIFLDAQKAGLQSQQQDAAQVAQALDSFVTPQVGYHDNKLLKRRKRAIERLSRLGHYGFCFFACMVLTLVANVLGEMLHHAFLSPMLHHLVLIGLLLGLGSWGAMRKVMDSFGLEQEAQRGRLVLSALAVAQKAGSREAILAAADSFLDDQAHWHALHRSHPIEAATGG